MHKCTQLTTLLKNIYTILTLWHYLLWLYSLLSPRNHEIRKLLWLSPLYKWKKEAQSLNTGLRSQGFKPMSFGLASTMINTVACVHICLPCSLWRGDRVCLLMLCLLEWSRLTHFWIFRFHAWYMSSTKCYTLQSLIWGMFLSYVLFLRILTWKCS